MKMTLASGSVALYRRLSALGSSRPQLWLALAAGTELAVATAAIARHDGTTGSVVFSSLIGVSLLWLVGRGSTWSWYMFVTLELVGLALIPIFFILVKVLPGLELRVDLGSVVASLVALVLVSARSVRPHSRHVSTVGLRSGQED